MMKAIKKKPKIEIEICAECKKEFINPQFAIIGINGFLSFCSKECQEIYIGKNEKG